MTSDNRNHETGDAAAETASRNPVPTVGEYLRSVREQQGLSIEDVARELRMPLQRLKLLEADDFSYLNSDTFVRGYLRAYAKLLQVDPAVPMGIYQRQLGMVAEQLAEDSESARTMDGGRPAWKLIAGVAGILVVLWIASVWFMGNRSESDVAPAPVSPVDYGIEYVVPTEPVTDEESEEPAEGGGAAEEREEKPSPKDRAARREVREDPEKGEEPSRVQDPQAKDAPGVEQESGEKKEPAPPEEGRGGESGTSDREEGS
jgi:cytoskeleton protein RodZ